MNENQLNDEVFRKCNNEIDHFIKVSERRLDDVVYQKEKSLRDQLSKLEERAEKELEKAKRMILLMTSAMVVLIISGLILFVNYEAKAVYDSIGDLKAQMEMAETEVEEARNNLSLQVDELKSVSEELSMNVNAAIDENRSVVAAIQTTQTQFERRLSEVTEEATASLNQQLANIQRESERLTEQLDVAMQQNESAIANLENTQYRFENRLNEVAEAEVQFQRLSSGLEDILDSQGVKVWRILYENQDQERYQEQNE
ncbi:MULTISPECIES: hypothetical protein [unclassified Halomonas]|jgi:cell division protein FtsL|uniref:hypothetical protein n=1 Tax=unclassified Halomonas TaxID=2609666 RepID=UPI001EF65853|nr:MULTISPECIES: hypothetical protein [unclassified Halomonas]MCG7576814.1 hypothetical protein [Halomonas sp. MMH1-48]MCG7603877.1 hypothetical protein [Halomonas sp. MM17-34]MCG7613127.1 hypothetical protein [Halomonas sp. MM17-29]MCG7619585.1 hypothetical protein [Halomonas sp. DSH1-27]